MKTINEVVFSSKIDSCKIKGYGDIYVSPEYVIIDILNDSIESLIKKYGDSYEATMDIKYNEIDRSVDVYYALITEVEVMFYKFKYFNIIWIGYDRD